MKQFGRLTYRQEESVLVRFVCECVCAYINVLASLNVNDAPNPVPSCAEYW